MDVSWAACSVNISEMYPSGFKDSFEVTCAMRWGFLLLLHEIQKELVFSSAKGSYVFKKRKKEKKSLG